MTPELEQKLNHLPRLPGVYQHKDANGTVLYVGKAKNLRNRVRSYFQTARNRENRITVLVKKIADVEVIVTDTESEALILENNLIKRYKPRYNILLRDDKTYPYICIKKERFPRIFPTRKLIRDGSRYFGPFSDIRSMRYMLDTIRGLFKLRSCNLYLSDANIQAGKFQACLDYHIQKCAAPCIGLETEEQYNEKIDQIISLLNGKTTHLIRDLRLQMAEKASERDYEGAAEIRDRIQGLETFSSAQKVVTDQPVDRDLFAIASDPETGDASGVLFKVRDGKMIGRQHKIMPRATGYNEDELIQAFVENYYADAAFVPDEIFLSRELADPEPLIELLRERNGRRVLLHVPKRGEKLDLMLMAEANAKLVLGEYQLQKSKQVAERIPRAVASLQRDLHLKKLPKRIECFDISHLSGTGTVASCVVFIDGKPRKSEYRTYKIQSVDGKPDDFQSMREVIARRYRRVVDAGGPIPDLIVIDGGKGQLSSAVSAMKEVGFYGQAPVVGLAKRLEEVFFPEDSLAIMIPKTSSALRLLQQTRDEAHRFAVAFQRKQRKNAMLHSELMEIPRVGARSIQKLLVRFGSVKEVRKATETELAECVGPALANRIISFYSTRLQSDDTRKSDQV